MNCFQTAQRQAMNRIFAIQFRLVGMILILFFACFFSTTFLHFSIFTRDKRKGVKTHEHCACKQKHASVHQWDRETIKKMSTQPFGTCLCEQRDSIQSQNTAPSYLVTFYVCVRNMTYMKPNPLGTKTHIIQFVLLPQNVIKRLNARYLPFENVFVSNRLWNCWIR